MPSSLNTVSSFDLDPFCMEDSQDYTLAVGSPISPPCDYEIIEHMFKDWMATEPPIWSEISFGQPSLSNASHNGSYSPLDDSPWSPFEETYMDSQALAQSNGQMENLSMNNSSAEGEENVLDIRRTSHDDVSNNACVRCGEHKSSKHGRTEDTKEDTNEERDVKEIKSEDAVGSPTTNSPPAAAKRSCRSPKPRTAAKTPRLARNTKKDTNNPKEGKSFSKRARLSIDDSEASSPKIRSGSPSSSPVDTRTNHNMIEKQYRNRLNLQFESLLEILPKSGVDEKRVGKAEVLVHANKYIQKLERDMKTLEEKNTALEGNVRKLERKWLNFGALPEFEI